MNLYEGFDEGKIFAYSPIISCTSLNCGLSFHEGHFYNIFRYVAVLKVHCIPNTTIRRIYMVQVTPAEDKADSSCLSQVSHISHLLDTIKITRTLDLSLVSDQRIQGAFHLRNDNQNSQFHLAQMWLFEKWDNLGTSIFYLFILRGLLYQ